MILGLKRKRRTGLDAKDIPGFAKWISAEVYVDDKIAEGCVESLALKMVGYSDWINEAMKDVYEGGGTLLESPVKDISPLRELRQREVEVIKEMTSLITEKTDEAEFNDSFELISRDIRKSYAAKQRESIKTAENEIKELSRLIDGDGGLFSDEDEDVNGNRLDNDEDVDVFDKIEVAQVHKLKTVSPIKFSEMPKIEPLTLRKKKKKIIVEKDRNVYKKVFKEERLSSVENSHGDLKLNPLPNAFFSTNGDTSVDEPTIKMKRMRPGMLELSATKNNVKYTTTTTTTTTTTSLKPVKTLKSTTPNNGNIPLARRRLKSDAGSDMLYDTIAKTAETNANTPLLPMKSLSHRGLSPRKSQRPSKLPVRVSKTPQSTRVGSVSGSGSGSGSASESPTKLPWWHPTRLKEQVRRQEASGRDPTSIFGPLPPLPEL